MIFFLLFWILFLYLKIGKLEKQKAEPSGIGKLNQVKKKEKEKRKELILGMLRENGRVTNDEVEVLLGFSDASATRYLEELEKEGKIRQIGESGKGVYYVIAQI